MKKINLNSMSLGELKELEMELPRVIRAREEEKRAAFIKRIAKEAEEEGLDPAEFVPGKGAAKKKSGGVVAPKYRDPSDPSRTWSGRGRQPKWFAAHVDAGNDPEDLLIASAA